MVAEAPWDKSWETLSDEAYAETVEYMQGLVARKSESEWPAWLDGSQSCEVWKDAIAKRFEEQLGSVWTEEEGERKGVETKAQFLCAAFGDAISPPEYYFRSVVGEEAPSSCEDCAKAAREDGQCALKVRLLEAHAEVDGDLAVMARKRKHCVKKLPRWNENVGKEIARRVEDLLAAGLVLLNKDGAWAYGASYATFDARRRLLTLTSFWNYTSEDLKEKRDNWVKRLKESRKLFLFQSEALLTGVAWGLEAQLTACEALCMAMRFDGKVYEAMGEFLLGTTKALLGIGGIGNLANVLKIVDAGAKNAVRRQRAMVFAARAQRIATVFEEATSRQPGWRLPCKKKNKEDDDDNNSDSKENRGQKTALEILRVRDSFSKDVNRSLRDSLGDVSELVNYATLDPPPRWVLVSLYVSHLASELARRDLPSDDRKWLWAELKKFLTVGLSKPTLTVAKATGGVGKKWTFYRLDMEKKFVPKEKDVSTVDDPDPLEVLEEKSLSTGEKYFRVGHDAWVQAAHCSVDWHGVDASGVALPCSLAFRRFLQWPTPGALESFLETVEKVILQQLDNFMERARGSEKVVGDDVAKCQERLEAGRSALAAAQEALKAKAGSRRSAQQLKADEAEAAVAGARKVLADVLREVEERLRTVAEGLRELTSGVTELRKLLQGAKEAISALQTLSTGKEPTIEALREIFTTLYIPSGEKVLDAAEKYGRLASKRVDAAVEKLDVAETRLSDLASDLRGSADAFRQARDDELATTPSLLSWYEARKSCFLELDVARRVSKIVDALLSSPDAASVDDAKLSSNEPGEPRSCREQLAKVRRLLAEVRRATSGDKTFKVKLQAKLDAYQSRYQKAIDERFKAVTELALRELDGVERLWGGASAAWKTVADIHIFDDEASGLLEAAFHSVADIVKGGINLMSHDRLRRQMPHKVRACAAFSAMAAAEALRSNRTKGDDPVDDELRDAIRQELTLLEAIDPCEAVREVLHQGAALAQRHAAYLLRDDEGLSDGAPDAGALASKLEQLEAKVRNLEPLEAKVKDILAAMEKKGNGGGGGPPAADLDLSSDEELWSPERRHLHPNCGNAALFRTYESSAPLVKKKK